MLSLTGQEGDEHYVDESMDKCHADPTLAMRLVQDVASPKHGGENYATRNPNIEENRAKFSEYLYLLACIDVQLGEIVFVWMEHRGISFVLFREPW